MPRSARRALPETRRIMNGLPPHIAQRFQICLHPFALNHFQAAAVRLVAVARQEVGLIQVPQVRLVAAIQAPAIQAPAIQARQVVHRETEMKTAIELADEFPEQNLANIEPDAAYLLNGWGLEAVVMLLQQAEQIEQLEVERLRLAGEVSNRNQRALEGDKSTAAFNTLYDEFEALRVERDALKADAERYRWMRTNSKSWSWTPSQYNIDIVSGFAAGGTGYLGHSFEDAINIASMKGKS
jgi:hypothetical protein